MVLRGDIGGRCGPLLAGVGAWLAAPHAVTPTNTVVDVDLTTANGSRTGIIYTLSNAVNGSVTLLPDGHTARFTPTANFNGLASFAFSFNALGNTITQTFGVCVSNGIPVELKWVGATTAWDLATTANFTDAGAPSTFTNGDAVTFDQTGTATSVALTGTNTFTGGTSVSGGSLTLGNAAGAGTGPITMDNTTFNIGAFNVANAVTFSGTNTLVGAAFAKLTTMSGDGTFAGSIRDGAGGAAAISSVTKAGTATLAGASTYTGATLLSSGTLNVTGSLGSMTVTVADGATLMGTGTIAAATLFPGAALAPGDNSAATFTVNGDLTHSSGTALNFDLGTVSDRVNVTGNLALNGTLNITDLGGMAGTLTGSGLTLGTAPAGSTYAVNTATPGLVRLIITPVSFLAWQRAYFTAAELGNTAISGPLSDANKDGEANLLEYATAQNPNGTTRATPTLVSNGATIEFTYIRSDAALADGVTFTVEWSDTLLNDWSKSGVSAPTVLSDNGTAQTVKVAVPFGAGGRRFVHLRVARP